MLIWLCSLGIVWCVDFYDWLTEIMEFIDRYFPILLLMLILNSLYKIFSFVFLYVIGYSIIVSRCTQCFCLILTLVVSCYLCKYSKLHALMTLVWGMKLYESGAMFSRRYALIIYPRVEKRLCRNDSCSDIVFLRRCRHGCVGAAELFCLSSSFQGTGCIWCALTVRCS